MQAVVLTIHLLLALSLILVVLLQRSEGGGLGMGSGGGGVMTSRGAATALSKLTWAIGIAFVATSLALTVLSAHDSRNGSVIDGGGQIESPAASTPAVPGLSGDLLPSTLPAQPEPAEPQPPADGPATPPPVQ